MSEQDRIQALGNSLASVADSLSASFARELARVLAAVERSLLPLLQTPTSTAKAQATRQITLRRELRAVLEKAGYDALVRRASVEAVGGLLEEFRAARGVGALGRVSATRLAALARTFELDLLGLGDQAAHQLWRAAVLAIYSDAPQATLLQQLANVLEKSFGQIQTLFDTQTSVIGRQIEKVLTDGRDDQAFLYVGPVDSRTREWCLEHVGLVFTRDAIDRLDNGQLPNVFLSGGGYNCRHSFLAVSDPQLVRLADTGQRAEGYDGRVDMARTLKRQRSRFRELRRVA